MLSLSVRHQGGSANRKPYAVSRIADRASSQHLWGHVTTVTSSVMHVTIWYSICHFLLVVLWNGIYLQPFSRYCSLSVLWSPVLLFKVTWRHRYPVCHFLLLVLCNQASIYIPNGFRDIQRQMQRNGWRDLDTTSKQRSRSLILVLIDFSYTTSYRLSIVTCFRTQHCSISATVSTVG